MARIEVGIPSALDELDGLRARIAELESQVGALRRVSVDALVFEPAGASPIFSFRRIADPGSRVDQLDQGAATIDPAGNVLRCNTRLTALLHLPADRIVDRPFRSHFDPADRGLLARLFERAWTESVGAEIGLMTSSGHRAPVFLSLAVLRDEPGLCALIIDMSEHKRTQRLLDTVRTAGVILDQVDDAVLVCDPVGRVVRASERAIQICAGNPLSKSLGAVLPLYHVCHRFPGAGGPYPIERCWAGGLVRGEAVEYLRPDGEVMSFVLSASPLYGNDGALLGGVITLAEDRR